MERWTYLILADAAGAPDQLRVFLRVGDDPARWPVTQITVDGREVAVDDRAKDYEAPEWKALEIVRANGVGDDAWAAVKDRLRAAAVSV